MNPALNVCEHGDHPAPTGQRFCSRACQVCEATDQPNNHECAGICMMNVADGTIPTYGTASFAPVKLRGRRVGLRLVPVPANKEPA